MLAERDYVLRLARQLAEAIARALKLTGEAKPEEAREGLRETCKTALGMEHEVLAMLDPQSAVELLSTPERIAAYVQLVEAMSEVEFEGGPLFRLRALELTEAGLARRRTPELEALHERLKL